MPNVESAKLAQRGGLYDAAVVMKKGHALPMSEVEKALAAADREMGDAMGTKYEVDASLALANVHFLKTKAKPDEAKLKEALAKLPGFKSVAVTDAGASPAFEGDKQPTLADVRKAFPFEVTDVYLAASRDGARYACPMHPDKASAAPGKCPTCDMDMVKGPASTAAKVPPVKPPPKKAGG